MSTGLTAEILKDAKDAFSLFAKGVSGALKTKDLGLVLRSLGFLVTPAELKLMEQDADPTNSGAIYHEAFMKQVSVAFGYSQAAKKAARIAFEKMGVAMALLIEGKKTSDGTIAEKDIKRALAKTGDRLTEEQLTQMLKDMDFERGRISIEAFSGFILA
jgi:Ca2+-binding EF-hand superfamily protein